MSYSIRWYHITWTFEPVRNVLKDIIWHTLLNELNVFQLHFLKKELRSSAWTLQMCAKLCQNKPNTPFVFRGESRGGGGWSWFCPHLVRLCPSKIDNIDTKSHSSYCGLLYTEKDCWSCVIYRVQKKSDSLASGLRHATWSKFVTFVLPGRNRVLVHVYIPF